MVIILIDFIFLGYFSLDPDQIPFKIIMIAQGILIKAKNSSSVMFQEYLTIMVHENTANLFVQHFLLKRISVTPSTPSVNAVVPL